MEGKQSELYEILNLTSKDVRELSMDDQDEVIMRAVLTQISEEDIDKLTEGVDHVSTDIKRAVYILLDRERRASYNNLSDYDKGWMSVERWRALLWTECGSEEQTKAYWKRIEKLLYMFRDVALAVENITSQKQGSSRITRLCRTLVTSSILTSGIEGMVSQDAIQSGCTLEYPASEELNKHFGTWITCNSEERNKLANCGKQSGEFRLRYWSEGAWVSKMLVSYKTDGKVGNKFVSGSGSSMIVPRDSTDIQVRFEVLRFIGVWCDLKKMDRKCQAWIEPREPHVFEYPETVIGRTFTIGGPLYQEAVIRVTDELLHDVDDM